MNTEVIITVVLVIVILAVIAYFIYKKKDNYEASGLLAIPPRDVKKYMSKVDPKSNSNSNSNSNSAKKSNTKCPYRGPKAPPPYLYAVNNQ
jgi:hypothetical protein